MTVSPNPFSLKLGVGPLDVSTYLSKLQAIEFFFSAANWAWACLRSECQFLGKAFGLAFKARPKPRPGSNPNLSQNT